MAARLTGTRVGCCSACASLVGEVLQEMVGRSKGAGWVFHSDAAVGQVPLQKAKGHLHMIGEKPSSRSEAWLSLFKCRVFVMGACCSCSFRLRERGGRGKACCISIWEGVFVIVVVVIIWICSRSEVHAFFVVSVSWGGRLLGTIGVVIVGVGVGFKGDVVISVFVEDCSFSCCRRRVWMLWMSSWLLAFKSTGVYCVGVVAVVMKGVVQCDVELGARDSVVVRGGVISIIGAERSSARIRLICRC